MNQFSRNISSKKEIDNNRQGILEDETLLLVIDMQEKLIRNIPQWPGVSRTETQIILSSYKD